MFKKSAILLTLTLLPLCSFGARPSILDVDQSLDESTLVMPASVEIDSRKMMHNWYLQNYATIDSMADYRQNVKVKDEKITERLSKIPAEIELPFNSLVRGSINFYTERRRSQVSNMLGLAHYYFPIFEKALDKYGIPQELKYLAVIESALDPNAVSPQGATGLWQFMTPTARGLNLEVNSLVDERRDPIKASEMAAKYLKELYSIYHDWSLAIASYNCGMGNVNKALRRVSSSVEKPDFWTIYPYLPAETRGYVPAFIAANYVMTYYNDHNIVPALIKRPLVTDSVWVNKRVHFQQIADVLQIPIEEIRLLNPQYRKDIIPGDIHSYALILPTQQIAAYIMSEDSIVAHDADKYARRLTVEPSDGSLKSISDDGNYIVTEKTYYHKVRRHETLASIARQYGVTQASIREANGGIRKVKRGKLLKIVVVKRQKRDNADDDLTKEPINVQDNDANNVNDNEPVEEVVTEKKQTKSQKNSVKDNSKKKDSNVKSSKKNSKKDKKEKSVTVTVRKGDNLSKIAQRNGTTVKKIKELNGLKSDKINAGQKLKVK